MLGFTYSGENDDTQYQNGNSAHLDWAASQSFSEQLHVGMVGYFYHQMNGDSPSRRSPTFVCFGVPLLLRGSSELCQTTRRRPAVRTESVSTPVRSTRFATGRRSCRNEQYQQQQRQSTHDAPEPEDLQSGHCGIV